MNGVLDRLLRRPGAAGYQTDEPRHWRRVPRINVFPRRAAGTQRRTLVRAALVSVLVIELISLYVQIQGKSADRSATETARTQLQQVQKDVAAEQAVIDEIQGKVAEAAKRVADASAGYERITSSQTNWYAGASSILSTRTEGIEFTSITTQPGGTIVLKGTASDLGAMSRFQSRLREISSSVRLQNISFETANTALGFTATLKVIE